jgi:hypothetical protein
MHGDDNICYGTCMVMTTCDLLYLGNVMVHLLEALLVGLVFVLVIYYGTYLRFVMLYPSDIQEHA